MSGKPKRQVYPLLRIFLATLEKSFSNSRKSSESTHPMIYFLRSLNCALPDDPGSLKYTLGMGYKKVIGSIGDVIGPDHAIVLNMLSHYTKHYNMNFVDEVGTKWISE
jgi:hypothetical protein